MRVLGMTASEVLVALNVTSCVYIAAILPCAVSGLADFVHKRYLYVDETTLYAVWAALFVGSSLLVAVLLVAGSNSDSLVRKAESCCAAIYAASAFLCCLFGNFPAMLMLLLVLTVFFAGRFVRSCMVKRAQRGD